MPLGKFDWGLGRAGFDDFFRLGLGRAGFDDFLIESKQPA